MGKVLPEPAMLSLDPQVLEFEQEGRLLELNDRRHVVGVYEYLRLLDHKVAFAQGPYYSNQFSQKTSKPLFRRKGAKENNRL